MNVCSSQNITEKVPTIPQEITTFNTFMNILSESFNMCILIYVFVL